MLGKGTRGQDPKRSTDQTASHVRDRLTLWSFHFCIPWAPLVVSPLQRQVEDWTGATTEVAGGAVAPEPPQYCNRSILGGSTRWSGPRMR